MDAYVSLSDESIQESNTLTYPSLIDKIYNETTLGKRVKRVENYSPLHTDQPLENIVLDTVEEPAPIKKELAVFVQMHNTVLLDELFSNISEIYSSMIDKKMDMDVYITVVTETDYQKVIDKAIGQKWYSVLKRIDLFTSNRGMDIGQFFYQLEKVIYTPVQYISLLKLHSKTDDRWRKEMITPFLNGNTPVMVNKMIDEPKFAIIGADSLVCRNLEFKESVYTREIEQAVFNRFSEPGERLFIAGSTFMIRYSVLKDFMNEEGVKYWTKRCYTDSPIGRCFDDIPHAFERFIGYYPIMKRLLVYGI